MSTPAQGRVRFGNRSRGGAATQYRPAIRGREHNALRGAGMNRQSTKERTMRVLVTIAIAAAAAAVSTAAGAADPLVKFIQGFNDVKVNIVPGTNECGINDPGHYQTALTKKLTDAGLKPDPMALSTAYLFIWGEAFGTLKQQCAVFMSLRLGADVSGTAVRIEAKVTDDKVLIEEAQRVEGTFPAAFYMTSRLFVKLEPSTADFATGVVDQLVDDMKKARGK
jgi:hypothetical protein